jgi:hypothetical protein
MIRLRASPQPTELLDITGTQNQPGRSFKADAAEGKYIVRLSDQSMSCPITL